MTRGQRKALIGLIAVVVAVLVVVGIMRRKDAPPTTGSAPAATSPAPKPKPMPPTATATAPTPPTPATARAPAFPPTGGQASQADRARALGLVDRGMRRAAANDLVIARQALADALNIGALPEDQADRVRTELTRIAQETLFATRKFPNDPSVVWHTFQPNEVLVRIERRLKLHVPTQLLLKINAIPDAAKIQARQTLKLIRGPFHAVVSKSQFTMDVYLEEPQTRRMVFVRRFRVGVGKDGSTPTGRWRLALGRKRPFAPWTPPTSSHLERKRVLWGEKGYPLGKKGYWIALEGIDGNIYTADDGYGIHGTNDPTSIGRASSLGCIRLVDDDIELVYAMLYEHWSTVSVVK